MPFICLARDDIPDGVLQVLDLWPNESQRSDIDPPGQTRYLRRTRRATLRAGAQAGTVLGNRAGAHDVRFTGLEAYLMDRVEPGSLEQATETVTMAAQPNVGDRVVIKGIIFEFQAGANPANWNAPQAGTDANPFLVGNGADADGAAANLTLAINDAADVQVALLAAAPANTTVVATNPAAPSPNVVLDAEDNAGQALLGRAGDLTVTVTVGAARITAPVTGRLGRANEAWDSANLTLVADAIQAEVDAGNVLTLAAIDALIVHGDLNGAAATSASTGAVADILSILAGRAYQVPAAAAKFTAAVAPDVIHLWDATQRGAFTTNQSHFGTVMNGGEITFDPTQDVNFAEGQSPNLANGGNGGEQVAVEVGNIRRTDDGSPFQASLQNGMLAGMQAGNVTLFPDSDLVPFFPTLYQQNTANGLHAGGHIAPVANARLVTVYNDDGTLA